MIYLHKILPTFVLPLMLVIIIILIGLIKNKKKLIYIAIGILYILSTPIFSNNFFKLVEGSEYRKNIRAIDSADAIIAIFADKKMMEIN
jgi:uncharacterized membrane protein